MLKDMVGSFMLMVIYLKANGLITKQMGLEIIVHLMGLHTLVNG